MEEESIVERFHFAYSHADKSCDEYDMEESLVDEIAHGLYYSNALDVELMASEFAQTRIVNAMFQAAHDPNLMNDHFVYLLTDNGQLIVAKGKKQFLKSHINDQLPPLEWTVGLLPIVFAPAFDLSGRTAIVTTKRLALKLREVASLILDEVQR